MAARGGAKYFDSAVGAVFFGIMVGLVRILPFGAFRLVGRAALAVYYFFAGQKLCQVAHESLGVAFGQSISDDDKRRISRDATDNLLNGFIGHAYSAWHPGFSDQIFSLEGKERLDAGLKKGKGAAIAIAHFGPFSWMLFKFVDLGYRVNIVMRPPRNAFMFKKFQEAKNICGINVIYSMPVRNCVVECLQALGKGELVFMPVDQNYGGKGRVFVDFFGRQAATAPGPVVFAQQIGAPLFFVYALPAEQGRFRITVSPEIELHRGSREREALIANTATVTKMVEEVAREHPEQWSWMHKRWKAVPREGER